MALVFIKYSNCNLLLIVTLFFDVDVWTSNSIFQLGHPDMEGGTCRKTPPSSQLHTWQSSHLSAGVPRLGTWALATGTEESERMDSWFLDYFILNCHKIYIIILSECHPRAFPASNVTIIKKEIILWKHSIYNCPGAKPAPTRLKWVSY